MWRIKLVYYLEHMGHLYETQYNFCCYSVQTSIVHRKYNFKIGSNFYCKIKNLENTQL